MSQTGTLDQRRSLVTLHSHDELCIRAPDAHEQGSTRRFEPEIEEFRAALGVGEEERLECWLLLDRSGSVLFDRDEPQEVDLAWHFASFDSSRDRIGILGFCGYGDYIDLFEFKTPLKEADRAMLSIADSGGGGTPTAEAVRHAAKMLRSSAAEHKVVVVVTDAPANDTAKCGRTVRAASRDGVRVIGVLKPESRLKHPAANNVAFMAEQFGFDWFEVDAFTETPRALFAHLAAMPRPRRGEAWVSHPASASRLPAGHEQLVSTAAEAFMALGDEAAKELSERALNASDRQLRAVAHYIRLRREQAHMDGEERLITALKAAGLR